MSTTIKRQPFPVHSAFNPQILEFDTMESSLSLNINIGQIILTAEAFNGVASFDLSNVERSLFANTLTEIDALANDGEWWVSSYVDGLLSASVNVVLAGVMDTTYIALNAALQSRQWSGTYNNNFVGKLITRFDKLKWYYGFPQVVSALSMSSGTFRFELNPVGGDKIYSYFTGLGRVVVSELNLYNGKSFEKGILYIKNNLDTVIDSIDVEIPNTNDNPFYVRWISRDACWEHWMFEAKQIRKRGLENQKTYEPYFDSQETADGFVKQITADGVDTIIVGSQNMNDNEFEVVSEMCYSPRIEFYDNHTLLWTPILLKSGDSENDNRESKNTLEFEFMMPKPQMQNL